MDGQDSASEPDRFRHCLQQVDACLVIAPEFDRLLYQRCEWVHEAGKLSLNCELDAITLCADKWQLAQHWTCHQVATPHTDIAGESPRVWPCVWKPRFGAGSTATRKIDSIEQARDYLRTYADEPLAHERIEQPFHAGQPVSISFLAGKNQLHALPPCTQNLSQDGRFGYLGGDCPLSNEFAERAEQLGRRAVQCIRGLKGYVGVDLILGESQRGEQDYAIEINPRLTTSYLGLRQYVQGNIAEALWQLVVHEEYRPLGQKSGRVQFTPMGRESDMGNIL